MVKWAGGGDVRALVREEVGTDKDGDEYALLVGLHDWLAANGKRDFTVKELVTDLFGKENLLSDAFDELRSVVGEIAGFDGKGADRRLDARRFGKRLARMNDLLQGGYRLKEAGTGHAGVVRWTVLKVGLVGLVGLVDPHYTRGKNGVSEEYRPVRDVTVGNNPPNQPIPLIAVNGYPESWDTDGGEE
jgi:hypothetical protein